MKKQIIAKTIYKWKNKIRGITVPNAKADYRTLCSKLCGIGRKINQQSRIKNLEIVPHKYFQVTLTTKKNQFNKRTIAFSTNGAGTIRHSQAGGGKKNFGLNFTPNKVK